jgi:WD40 repeat protein
MVENLALRQQLAVWKRKHPREGSLVTSDGSKLWRAGRNQELRTQILGDLGAAIFEVAACGTQYLVFSWAFHDDTNQTNIWRANADGTDPEKLTNGKDDRNPVCSPADNRVYYFDFNRSNVMTVPLTATAKAEIVPNSAIPHTLTTGRGFSLSPHNKFLAYTVATVFTPRKCKIALLDLTILSSPSLIDVDDRIVCGGVNFTSDGTALAYAVRENGVDNIWVQPLDGSAGHPITNFKSDQIDSFQWSPDEKTLGLVRNRSESDVVLLQEVKP